MPDSVKEIPLKDGFKHGATRAGYGFGAIPCVPAKCNPINKCKMKHGSDITPVQLLQSASCFSKASSKDVALTLNDRRRDYS